MHNFAKPTLFCSPAVISSVSALELSGLGLNIDSERVFCEGWALATHPSRGSFSNLPNAFISGEKIITSSVQTELA